jgi:hypothetical protein
LSGILLTDYTLKFSFATHHCSSTSSSTESPS